MMAQDTVRFLETVVGRPARLLGCSDGAVVALLVALRRPDLVTRLVFVAGVFHHDGWIPDATDPANEPPEFLADPYAELSPDVYRAPPHGELAVVPGTSHGLLVEKPELCNRMIVDFLTTDPVETFAPIRRRAN
jgi:pimeloyl-ACP methyl ester carboxylesterase